MAKPVTSSPMIGQEDQDGARAGEVTPKEVKQPQTRQRLNLGQLNEIPHSLKLLYIPTSPVLTMTTLPILGTTMPSTFKLLPGVSSTGPGTSHYKRRTCERKKNTSPLLSDKTVIPYRSYVPSPPPCRNHPHHQRRSWMRNQTMKNPRRKRRSSH